MTTSKPPDKIQVVGQVYKVQTLVDGGIRITIDLPETAVNVMAQLAKYQINGVAVKISIGTVKNGQETDDR